MKSFTIPPPALLTLLLAAATTTRAAEPLTNLAAQRPATASSSRSKTQQPAAAVDADPKTRWCTNDPKAPSWWMVDLGEPHNLGGCEITWERKDLIYNFIIEGSLDGTSWTLLNDHRGNEDRTQSQRLALPGTRARYVRISINSVERAGFASFSEVQLFDAESIQKLPPEEARTFLPDEPFFENLALNKPAIASSVQGDNVAVHAIDDVPSGKWCAGDPSFPQWWEVDLEAVKSIAQIQIRWESSNNAYRFVIEGSTDNLEWQVLEDQRNNNDSQQVQKFPLSDKKARYLRVTVTGVAKLGSWASFTEFKAIETTVPTEPRKTGESKP